MTVTSTLPTDPPTTVAETIIASSTTVPVASEPDESATTVPPTTTGADTGLPVPPTTSAQLARHHPHP